MISNENGEEIAMPYNHRAIEELFLKLEEQEYGLKNSRKGEANRCIDGSFILRDDIRTLKELRVAAIMDSFTVSNFAPECQLLELVSDTWQEQIDAFLPDLIFVESAWNGKENSWFRKIDRENSTISQLLGYCRGLGIPSIFWNKEDPISTAIFIPTAKLCDFIFTTDIDCIDSYKRAVNHEHVYHLHFSAQPEVHNPFEKYERRQKICFAGAYYPRYPERLRIMEAFTNIFVKRNGIDIYDRNYGTANSPYAFPEFYKPYILGRLENDDIDIAYKGYEYGLNLNSVTQSQTMFARRVFELLASNTVVIGNYSRGVRNYFGDLTICTDSEKKVADSLDWLSTDDTFRKYRLLGLRKVLTAHLTEDRLDEIVQKVFGVSLKKAQPLVHVYAVCKEESERKRVRQMFDRQTYKRCKLIFLDEENTINEGGDEIFITCFSAKDYYGSNYLTDMMLSIRYSSANGFAKPVNGKDAYKLASKIPLKRCVVRADTINGIMIGPEIEIEIEGNLLNIDEFNYKENYALDSCPEVDDLQGYNEGGLIESALSTILFEPTSNECSRRVIAMPPSASKITKNTFDIMHIVPESMFNDIRLPKNSPFTYSLEEGALQIKSSMSEGQTQYIFMGTSYRAEEYSNHNIVKVTFHMNGELQILGSIWFFDKQHLRIGAEFLRANEEKTFFLPKEANYFKLGFRILGKGKVLIKAIDVVRRDVVGLGPYVTNKSYLMMTNVYPSAGNLYRNMFVHRRIMRYREAGLHMDVMVFRQGAHRVFREFEGVDVLEGKIETFAKMMRNGAIETICIHFLLPQMWDAIKPYLKTLRIIIWCHGYEIDPWYNRSFSYKDEAELEMAKRDGEERMRMWYDVFECLEHHKIHLVFVSKYLANEISKNYGVLFSANKFSVIHNVVDTELFRYHPKTPEHRLRLLSIRPFASSIYANDLTVKCIQELSNRPFFPKLHFLIIGDGVLFDEITKPLRTFSNVKIQREFLSQNEIAEKHKEYGIFIIPTRLDTHGVSRDEAMSSGLVPVTNSIAAIPEFVDETCCLLAPPEDYVAMADRIEEVYHNPTLFLQMSKNASKRVRTQTSKEYTIDKEIALILNKEVR